MYVNLCLKRNICFLSFSQLSKISPTVGRAADDFWQEMWNLFYCLTTCWRLSKEASERVNKKSKNYKSRQNVYLNVRTVMFTSLVFLMSNFEIRIRYNSRYDEVVINNVYVLKKMTKFFLFLYQSKGMTF